MKIRLEKVEIEISNNIVDAVTNGILRVDGLKHEARMHERRYEADVQRSVQEGKANLLAGLLPGLVSILREAMSTQKTETETETKQDGAPQEPEEPSDD